MNWLEHYEHNCLDGHGLCLFGPCFKLVPLTLYFIRGLQFQVVTYGLFISQGSQIPISSFVCLLVLSFPCVCQYWRSLSPMGLFIMHGFQTGYDGILAETQSTSLKHKRKDWNSMTSVYQSLNLNKSGHQTLNKTSIP